MQQTNDGTRDGHVPHVQRQLATYQCAASSNVGERQVRNARRALVYGNGGIFSASAVALLAKAVEE